MDETPPPAPAPATNMSRCNRDLTGLPEWVKADYFQAHKDHGCLWGDPSEAREVKPKFLDAMLTARLPASELREIQDDAAYFGVGVSVYVRSCLSAAHAALVRTRAENPEPADPENP